MASTPVRSRAVGGSVATTTASASTVSPGVSTVAPSVPASLARAVTGVPVSMVVVRARRVVRRVRTSRTDQKECEACETKAHDVGEEIRRVLYVQMDPIEQLHLESSVPRSRICVA